MDYAVITFSVALILCCGWKSGVRVYDGAGGQLCASPVHGVVCVVVFCLFFLLNGVFFFFFGYLACYFTNNFRGHRDLENKKMKKNVVAEPTEPPTLQPTQALEPAQAPDVGSQTVSSNILFDYTDKIITIEGNCNILWNTF